MSRVYCTVELSHSPTLSKGQAQGEVGVVMVIFSDSELLVEVGILGSRHDLLRFCHHKIRMDILGKQIDVTWHSSVCVKIGNTPTSLSLIHI